VVDDILDFVGLVARDSESIGSRKGVRLGLGGVRVLYMCENP
jgi:hypothetical protein